MSRSTRQQTLRGHRGWACRCSASPQAEGDFAGTRHRAVNAGRAIAFPSRGAPRAGFTLIELLVALSIAGLVLVSARALLTAAAESADRISLAAVAADLDANTERLLRSLFLQVDAAPGDQVRFIGDERAVRFGTWCDVPAGWQERCTVTLGLVRLEDDIALTLLIDDREMIIVRSGAGSAALRYLYSPATGGTWLRKWESVTSTPLAVAAIVDGDTLFLRIGERG